MRKTLASPVSRFRRRPLDAHANAWASSPKKNVMVPMPESTSGVCQMPTSIRMCSRVSPIHLVANQLRHLNRTILPFPALCKADSRDTCSRNQACSQHSGQAHGASKLLHIRATTSTITYLRATTPISPQHCGVRQPVSICFPRLLRCQSRSRTNRAATSNARQTAPMR